MVFFTAVPIWHWFTFVANRRELRVSEKHSSLGETLTNMSVLEFPPSEPCRRCVSFELR